jgi:hypothetical protein
VIDERQPQLAVVHVAIGQLQLEQNVLQQGPPRAEASGGEHGDEEPGA